MDIRCHDYTDPYVQYNQTQNTFTHCNYKDIKQRKRNRAEEKVNIEARRCERSWGWGSESLVLDLFYSAGLDWVPLPRPVKSPHKFIKDENRFSIWKEWPTILKTALQTTKALIIHKTSMRAGQNLGEYMNINQKMGGDMGLSHVLINEQSENKSGANFYF